MRHHHFKIKYCPIRFVLSSEFVILLSRHRSPDIFKNLVGKKLYSYITLMPDIFKFSAERNLKVPCMRHQTHKDLVTIVIQDVWTRPCPDYIFFNADSVCITYISYDITKWVREKTEAFHHFMSPHQLFKNDIGGL